MRYGIICVSQLAKRMDVNYHLSHEFDLEKAWLLSEIKEVIVRDPNCYGFSYCENGVPIIRIGNLTNPFIDFTDIAKISPKVHKRFSKTHLQKYDILMSVRGVSIGQIGIFLGEFEEANISPNIIIIRLRKKHLAQYVAMVMVSSIVQSQIKKILAGSSKPTITSPLIGQLKIPIPSKKQLNEINSLFFKAEVARKKSSEIVSYVQEHLKEWFRKFIEPKAVSFPITILALSNRWDPHYHNICFQKLRSRIAKWKSIKAELHECTKHIEETVTKTDDKIGYIEINNINNREGMIQDYSYDYIKKLPTGRKLLLKNGDLLISKVRPYRNAIAIFRQRGIKIVTASHNAFAVYRTQDYKYPYYLLAFLRHEIGLNQIVMNQSGTTYPTVTDDEISQTQILNIDDATMENINAIYSEHLDSKEQEGIAKKNILNILQSM